MFKRRRRFGSRIFLTFLLFALLPLLAFAWHARVSVTAEFEREAERRLHEYARSAGILITERLVLATGELRLRLEGEGGPWDEIAREAPLRRIVPAREVGFDAYELDFELARPAGGLLRIRRDGPGAPRIWLLARKTSDNEVYAAEVEPRYLFHTEGLERPPTQFSVHLPDGEFLHSSGLIVPSRELLKRAGLGHRARADLVWDDERGRQVGAFREVFLQPQFGQNLVVVVNDHRSSIFTPIEEFERDMLLVALLTTAVAGLVSLVRIRKMTAPVHALEEASERIARQDFEVLVDEGQAGELEGVVVAFNEMARNLKRRMGVMEALNDFGAALAREVDPHSIIEKLVEGAEGMFGVDGILVHLMDRDEALEVERLRIRSMGIDLHAGAEELEYVGAVNRSAVSKGALVTRQVAGSDSRILLGLRAFATRQSYELLEVVELPLLDHEGLVLGVITLFNARDDRGEPLWFDAERIELATSLAGQASAALANVQLRHEFKTLFDALIEMLAVAVDEKSDYTGGHCRRVPDLAMMIFDAVQEDREGTFRDVTFDEHEVYEMQVASLLHDCGKVVTPVHVMDKSTKLETIWDRIHLVEQRFDLVAHAVEAQELRRVAQEAGLDLKRVEDRVLTVMEALRADREFLRRVNVGGEFMVDEDVERVASMASEWPWRDLDGEIRPFLSEDEIANLSIRKGTLTREERTIINRHMDVTVKMLDGLPFPRRLSQVSLIAGSHHERLDGKGFPRGLTEDQIPLQGKMLAIADVFEALTASDRPYKPGMKISQSLAIMRRMTMERHFDPDLLVLFVRSHVWRRYAERHLHAEQIDVVDEDALCEGLGTAAAGGHEALARCDADASAC